MSHPGAACAVDKFNNKVDQLPGPGAESAEIMYFSHYHTAFQSQQSSVKLFLLSLKSDGALTASAHFTHNG